MLVPIIGWIHSQYNKVSIQMKHIAIIVLMLLVFNCLQANGTDKGVERVLFHSYDSIRKEMIKTTCNIWGVKDSTLLEEILEGRADTGLLRNNQQLLVQIIKQSNRNFYGSDPNTYNNIARIIRANLMGHLLICDYKKEKDILDSFNTYEKELNAIFIEAADYKKAKENNKLEHFKREYPDSKFNRLILLKSKECRFIKDKLLLLLVFAILCFILSVIYLLYKLKIKNKKILALQLKKIAKNKNQKEDKEKLIEKNYNNNFEAENAEKHLHTLNTDLEDQCLDNINNKEENVDVTNINAFAEENEKCIVVGTSVIGSSHISMGLPCQDNCKYSYYKNGWGIAITSDGAGSAEHSDIGSRIIVERGLYYFFSVIEQKRWAEKDFLPTEAEWTNIAYTTLKAIRNDLEKFASVKNMKLSSLNSTIIVVIHTPMGFLTTHVGDGRAGYKDDSNEWNAFFTPHKGDEANQTIFLTSDFWNIPYYVMSGVMVPESRVVRCNPVAFTLMSDGCEHTAWLCNIKNGATGMYYDPNKPFDRFFNPLIEDLSENVKDDLKTRWAKYIISGNDSFKNESDDKTMILGVIK